MSRPYAHNGVATGTDDVAVRHGAYAPYGLARMRNCLHTFRSAPHTHGPIFSCGYNFASRQSDDGIDEGRVAGQFFQNIAVEGPQSDCACGSRVFVNIRRHQFQRLASLTSRWSRTQSRHLHRALVLELHLYDRYTCEPPSLLSTI